MAKAKYEVQMYPHADDPKAWSAKVTPYYDRADFAPVFGRMEKAMVDHGASVKRDGRTWQLAFLRPPKKAQLESLSRAIQVAWTTSGLDHITFGVLLPADWTAPSKALTDRLTKTEIQALSHKRFKQRLSVLPKRKLKHKELLWWLEGVAARTNLPLDEIMAAMEGVVK